MYYEDLLDNAVDDETSDFRLKQKNTANDLKNLDKKYEKYRVLYNNIGPDGKYHKYITIENYGSGSCGTRIRNAVTGTYYNFIVGSSAEDLFFKVIEATGRGGRKESIMLYYDSPEQYENHHLNTVSQEAKERWLYRSLQAQKLLNM